MFKNMRLATQLILGFGVIICLLLIVAIVGYFGISSIFDKAEYIIQVDAKTSEYAARARANVEGSRRYEKDVLLNIGSKEKVADYYKKWQEDVKSISSRINDLEKVVISKEDRDLVTEMKKELSIYETGFIKVMEMITSGRVKSPHEGNAAMEGVKGSIRKLEENTKAMAQTGIKRMEAAQPSLVAAKAVATIIMIILALIAILIGVTASILIIRHVLHQVGGEPAEIAEVANQIAAGNLIINLNTANKSATGILGAMCLMTDKLKRLIAEIKASSESLGSGSTQLSASSEEISRNMLEQANRSGQIATATDEMSQTVMDIAKNIAGIANSAKSATEKAHEGELAVKQSVNESNAISETVNASASVMKNLGEKSAQIGEIVSVINDIADQTNLLALNAAIEAARAGEQGRGFAVVADEVRKLAERTAKATAEISSMIQAVQSEVQDAIGSMDDATKRVETGVKMSSQAGNVLVEIVASVNNLQSMVQQIASATEEMSTVADTISNDVQNIATSSKEISIGSDQIAQTASEIARQGSNLQVSVRQFKV